MCKKCGFKSFCRNFVVNAGARRVSVGGVAHLDSQMRTETFVGNITVPIVKCA